MIYCQKGGDWSYRFLIMASNFVCNYSMKNTVNVNVLNNVCIYFLLCVLFGFLYMIIAGSVLVIYHLSVSCNLSTEAYTNI